MAMNGGASNVKKERVSRGICNVYRYLVVFRLYTAILACVRWLSFVPGPARVGDIAFVRLFFARPERGRLHRKVKLGTSVGVLRGGFGAKL
jgi:hypothetical protein